MRCLRCGEDTEKDDAVICIKCIKECPKSRLIKGVKYSDMASFILVFIIHPCLIVMNFYSFKKLWNAGDILFAYIVLALSILMLISCCQLFNNMLSLIRIRLDLIGLDFYQEDILKRMSEAEQEEETDF